MSAAPNQNASALSIFLSGSKKTSALGPAQPRVMVVEPDESSRSVLRVALSAEGFEVQMTSSAEEALRMLHSQRVLPAAVVVEATLPGADGFSLCGQIRAGPKTAGLPVILTARRHESYYPEMAEGVGADDYLPKPLFARDIAALLRLKLSQSGEGASALTTTELPLPALVRALLAGVRSGRIALSQGRGHLCFRQGQVVEARFDRMRGPDALMRILLLVEGPYAVQLGSPLGRPEFAFGLQELLATTYPRILRWRELVQRSLPLEAVLQVDFKQLAQVLPQLPDGVNELVRLFDGQRNVRQALLDCPLDEMTALEVIVRLYVMGVVVPQLPLAPATASPRRAATLFEPASRGEGLEGLLIEQDPGDEWYSALEEKLFGDADEPSRTERAAQLAAQEILSTPAHTAPVSEVLADSLTDSGARQLNAFRIQTVVEPALSATPSREVQDFVRGHRRPDDGSLERSVVAVPAPAAGLGQDALERHFFGEEEDTQPLRMARRSRPFLAPWVEWSLALALVALSVAGFAVWYGRMERAPSVPVPAVAQVAPPAVGAKPLPEVVAPRSSPSLVSPVAPPALPALAPVRAQPASAPAAPPPQPSLVARGMALYEAGHPKAAVELLTQAVESAPNSADAWLALGLAQFDSHDRAGAKAAAVRALELRPNHGAAVILLATALLDEGEQERARAQLQRYLELEPSGPFAADARQLLADR